MTALHPITQPAQTPRQRLAWLDAAKGLGIALIVWGHIYSITEPTTLQVYVYAFHVPLFFFISGLTFDPARNSFSELVRSKARALLLPYLVYAFLGFLFYLAGYLFAQRMGLKIAQFDYGLWPPLLGIFYGSLGDGHLVNTPVWFVVALFCTLMLGKAINQPTLPRIWRIWLALIIGALGYVLGGVMKLPFSLGPAMLGLVFFQAAVEMKAWIFELQSRPQTLWLTLIASLAVSAFSPINGFVAQATPAVGNFGWFLLFGFAGTLATLALVQLLDARLSWLATLGRYSLSIMVIHFLIIKSVKVVMTSVAHIDLDTIDASTAYGAVVLMATTALLVPAIFIMERYLPWTLGKKANGNPAVEPLK
ncbi:MAG: acyltransferase family protein [Burkholderiaceae bacterium]